MSYWVAWNLFAVWEYLPLNVPRSCHFIVQFLIIPSFCEVSLRKQFQKTPGKCRIFWVCDKTPKRLSVIAAKFKGPPKILIGL